MRTSANAAIRQQQLAELCYGGALVIVETQAPPAHLFTEDRILLFEEVDDGLLLTVGPACEHEGEETNLRWEFIH